VSSPSKDLALIVTLSKADAGTFVGPVYRVISGTLIIKNLDFEHLRAGTAVGRCNPPGVARIYMSLQKETAQSEFDYYERKAGFDPALSDSYSFAADVKLTRVLDLRLARTRRQVGITLTEIRKEWDDPALVVPTRLQSIGSLIARGYGGFSAMIYPSAQRRGGHNIVIFRDQIASPDYVTPLSAKATKEWA
jgi:RES domain-containing protein